MRKLPGKTKGAVTVFVTLLLIPAMLVSGTAVDLARIHAAHSTLQDANQLASNTVLTQYNALLYDLYGVMGIAGDDPILDVLLDEYIRVAVFGEELQDRTLGTLQLLYGSDLSFDDIEFAYDKNLRNEDVLRRQIEEYMKFRGPVILVKQIIEALGSNKLKEDAEVIYDKMEIDSEIAEMFDKYKELYEAIIAADKCNQAIGGIAGGAFGSVSSTLKLIRSQFVALSSCYDSWQAATESSLIAALEADYTAILNYIRAYVVGGTTPSGGYAQGLNQTIANAKTQAENFKPKFDAVVSIAREIDEMNKELKQKVDELERKLDSGECSDELRMGLMERHGSPPMTIIERYRDILKWEDIAGLATTYKNGGYNYIDNSVKPLLDGVRYRNSTNSAAASLSLAELSSLTTTPGFSLSGTSNRASVFASFPENSITYGMPPGFLKFAEHSGRHREFFDALTAMVNQPPLDPVKLYDGQENASGSNSEAKQRNMIKDLLTLIETAYQGLCNSPLGADYISDSSLASMERMGIVDIATLIPQAFKEPVLSVVYDPLGSLAKVGDYLLLFTYSTSMFSNYATARPDCIGKTEDELKEIEFPKTITGVPMNNEVNYFFQSEWEYLYSGHDNAGKNLNAVSRLIFLIRLVRSYIVVFSVSEVTTIVTSIFTAFAWCPPLALVLSELARMAFAAAESLIDVAALRSGYKVPLLKVASRGDWVCSPSGVMKAVKDLTSDDSVDGAKFGSDKGLIYSHYMQVFFLTKALFYSGRYPNAATELAIRTGDLIEWNMVNYQNGVKANEAKMAEALGKSGRFSLSNMKTDFSIKTSVNLRLLFLSKPFAQAFSDDRGIGMPGNIHITATDYKGY